MYGRRCKVYIESCYMLEFFFYIHFPKLVYFWDISLLEWQSEICNKFVSLYFTSFYLHLKKKKLFYKVIAKLFSQIYCWMSNSFMHIRAGFDENDSKRLGWKRWYVGLMVLYIDVSHGVISEKIRFQALISLRTGNIYYSKR